MSHKKKRITDFIDMKRAGRKITVLTAFDYAHAKIMNGSTLDAILVGDSLGMVALGYESTLSVTMEDMLCHLKAVRRGASETFIIADMPYMSYHTDVNTAVMNAGRLIVEGGADAVKVEGGTEMADVVAALKRAKIPVVGHVGLTPQSVNVMGGYTVQGRNMESAREIMEGAVAFQKSGAFAIVMECIPEPLARVITAGLKVPTIGIGSGKSCDGQVLVIYDMLGMLDDMTPSFVKRYDNLSERVMSAIGCYIDDVRTERFPGVGNSNQDLNDREKELSEVFSNVDSN
jgi:3-methyl-2-oxobutanoate hydroxymethyltransferase